MDRENISESSKFVQEDKSANAKVKNVLKFGIMEKNEILDNELNTFTKICCKECGKSDISICCESYKCSFCKFDHSNFCRIIISEETLALEKILNNFEINLSYKFKN